MFALTLGNGGAMLDMGELGLRSIRSYGIFANGYTIYDYRNTMQSIKKSKLKN